jgi:predicted dehydrogenase
MLKGGFIGFGRMGITHFSILNSHPSVVVKGVCDSSNTMMNILKKYTNIRTNSNYKKMIDEVPLDFIVISTPTDSHSEIIRFALEHNIHVFCEKPFGLNISESKTVLDLLSSRRLVNQIGYVNRFNEIFMEVKRLIDAGVLGEINYFCSEMYGATVLKDSSSSWRGKRTTGGGCMYEFASHCID